MVIKRNQYRKNIDSIATTEAQIRHMPDGSSHIMNVIIILRAQYKYKRNKIDEENKTAKRRINAIELPLDANGMEYGHK